MSEKRPESVQLATPNPMSEMPTSCGQRAGQRDAHMVTRSHATKTRATKQQCGKQFFKCSDRGFNKTGLWQIGYNSRA